MDFSLFFSRLSWGSLVNPKKILDPGRNLDISYHTAGLYTASMGLNLFLGVEGIDFLRERPTELARQLFAYIFIQSGENTAT